MCLNVFSLFGSVSDITLLHFAAACSALSKIPAAIPASIALPNEESAYFISKEELYGEIPTSWDDGSKIQFYPTVEMALSCEHRDITHEEYYVIEAVNANINLNHEAIGSTVFVNTVDHIRVGLGVESADPDLRKCKCFDWSYTSIDM